MPSPSDAIGRSRFTSAGGADPPVAGLEGTASTLDIIAAIAAEQCGAAGAFIASRSGRGRWRINAATGTLVCASSSRLADLARSLAPAQDGVTQITKPYEDDRFSDLCNLGAAMPVDRLALASRRLGKLQVVAVVAFARPRRSRRGEGLHPAPLGSTRANALLRLTAVAAQTLQMQRRQSLQFDLTKRSEAGAVASHDDSGGSTDAQLRRVNASLRATLASIGDGVLVADAGDRVRYLNAAAEEITGWRCDTATGRSLAEIYPLAPLPAGIDAMDGGDGDGTDDCATLTRRDGERILIEQTVRPMRQDTDAAGTVFLFRDVTLRRQMNRRIQFQATHDALTGLTNRYEFERRLEAAVVTAGTEEAVHAVLFLDLDRFKLVNDSAGHSAGDELLARLGRRLRGQVRAGDTVARLGGDEFAILLQGCGETEALELASRLRTATRRFRFSWNRTVYQVSVSIGVAMVDATTRSARAVLDVADHACYAAKHGGGDGVELGEASATCERRRKAGSPLS